MSLLTVHAHTDEFRPNSIPGRQANKALKQQAVEADKRGDWNVLKDDAISLGVGALQTTGYSQKDKKWQCCYLLLYLRSVCLPWRVLINN